MFLSEQNTVHQQLEESFWLNSPSTLTLESGEEPSTTTASGRKGGGSDRDQILLPVSVSNRAAAGIRSANTDAGKLNRSERRRRPPARLLMVFAGCLINVTSHSGGGGGGGESNLLSLALCG